MAPPITEFVDITVNLAAGPSEKFSFGTLLGAFAHTQTANRVDGPFTSLDEVNDAGFTSTNTPEVNAWATAALEQDNGVDQILVGRHDAGDSSWSDALDAIDAADDDFYILNIGSRDKTDILSAASWIETRRKIAIFQSADSDVLAGTAGNVALSLNGFNYVRSGYIWHAFSDHDDGDTPSDGYLDGAWCGRCGGFNLDSENGVGQWGFKKCSGVTADKFTSAQTTNLYNAKANLFGRTAKLPFTSKGTMAGGRFIDITTSIDWLKTRLEENILSTFVNIPTGVAFTSEGMNLIRAAAQEVFNKGETCGHLSKDAPATIKLPKIGDVSSSDKANRLLAMTADATLAGGIAKVTLGINLLQ